MIEAGQAAIDPIDWSILRGEPDFYREVFLAMVDVALREGVLGGDLHHEVKELIRAPAADV